MLEPGRARHALELEEHRCRRLSGPSGWLGPYLNVFPLLTIGLFIWQQKMFMPPPADEQAAMQQKIMQYMMIFMGVMFFKVASGLCLYFIASSLWGIAERKLLPRSTLNKARFDSAGAGARWAAFSSERQWLTQHQEEKSRPAWSRC